MIKSAQDTYIHLTLIVVSGMVQLALNAYNLVYHTINAYNLVHQRLNAYNLVQSTI